MVKELIFLMSDDYSQLFFFVTDFLWGKTTFERKYQLPLSNMSVIFNCFWGKLIKCYFFIKFQNEKARQDFLGNKIETTTYLTLWISWTLPLVSFLLALHMKQIKYVHTPPNIFEEEEKKCEQSLL